MKPREIAVMVRWLKQWGVSLEYGRVAHEKSDYAMLHPDDVWLIPAPAGAAKVKALRYRIMTRALRALGPGVVRVRHQGDWIRVTRKDGQCQ